jgi:hypothetical protein
MDYRRNAPVLGLLLGLLFGASAEAMPVKCRPMADSIPIRNTTPLLVVDGQVKGDVTAPGPDSTAIAGIKREEILYLSAICLVITEAGVKVKRGAIAVITRAGAVQFMKSQLQGLVDQQEEYRARTGEYARNLSNLEFVATRAPLVIDMQGSRGGWSANVTLAGVPTSCGVKVARAVTGRAAPAVLCN